MTTTAYPLAWPAGRPRTSYPSRSRFGDRSLEQSRRELQHEVKLLGGFNFVLSTNVRLRNDGFPYSNDKPPADKGVAVYFTYKKRSMCFACDRWDTVPDNVYAIAKTVEALRGIERWGSGEMVEQAFTGFVALPSDKPAFEILGVRPNATIEEIDAAYREKAKRAHPDVGGTAEQMTRLNSARERMKSAHGK